jgi:hypothetical protein
MCRATYLAALRRQPLRRVMLLRVDCFGLGEKGSKVFFSEEKNQKTFASPQLAVCQPCPKTRSCFKNKSLLLLFFRKEDLPSFFSKLA